jgi:hypothetical protein
MDYMDPMDSMDHLNRREWLQRKSKSVMALV